MLHDSTPALPTPLINVTDVILRGTSLPTLTEKTDFNKQTQDWYANSLQAFHSTQYNYLRDSLEKNTFFHQQTSFVHILYPSAAFYSFLNTFILYLEQICLGT